MNPQTYILTSPVFRVAERSSERVRLHKTIESVRYLIKRLFGCWHLQLSRPLTRGTHTYRVCAKCGMRREFDLNTWKTKGRYHSEPVGKSKVMLMRERDAVANNRQETVDHSSESAQYIHLSV